MTSARPGGASSKAQVIAAEVRRRIVDQEWQQGDRIPDEADLAVEFSAARATVNKALQVLAEEGLLDRKRRAGTRVTINPVRKATFTIPIVREQVESAGMAYSYRLIARRRSPLPADIAARIGLRPGVELIRLRSVHYGDGKPFQFEERWLNPLSVRDIEAMDFRHISANEWLVRNAPYVRADLAFSAENADARDARLLQAPQGQALLILKRTTWNDLGPITTVRIAHHPGYAVSATN